MIFKNRTHAGELLAKELPRYANGPDVVVIGLARGGVVIAAAIAKELHVALDVMVVKKVGAPDNEELALGAVSDEGEGVFNDELITLLGVSKEYLHKEIERQRELVKQKKELFFQGSKGPKLEGKDVILVDDGIATGASMKVAIASALSQSPKKLIVAVPVAASESLKTIRPLVDQVVCLSTPAHFGAVGAYYQEFAPVEDGEIIDLIAKR